MSNTVNLSALSDADLYSQFSAENWARYTKDGRMALARELERREAERAGRSCFPVRLLPDKDAVNGRKSRFWSADRSLQLHPAFFSDTPQEGFEPGTLMLFLLHEGRHGYQNEAVDAAFQAEIFREPLETIIRWNIENTSDYTDQYPFYGVQEIETDARYYAFSRLTEIAKALKNANLPCDHVTKALKQEREDEIRGIRDMVEDLTAQALAEREEKIRRKNRRSPEGSNYTCDFAHLLVENAGEDPETLFAAARRLARIKRERNLSTLQKMDNSHVGNIKFSEKIRTMLESKRMACVSLLEKEMGYLDKQLRVDPSAGLTSRLR